MAVEILPPPESPPPYLIAHLQSVLQDTPYDLLRPTESLRSSLHASTKQILDPLANLIAPWQQNRLRQQRRERKRKRAVDEDDLDAAEGNDSTDAIASHQVLRLRQIHVDGFQPEQIWEQARRVLEASLLETERSLHRLRSQRTTKEYDPTISQPHVSVESIEKATSAAQEEANELNQSDSEDEISNPMQGDEAGSTELDEDNFEDAASHLGIDSEDDEGIGAQSDKTFVKDPNGLNDGFFSIDDFNAQADFLERQDARGDPNDGAASDEEDVDWTVDPMTATTVWDPRVNGGPADDSSEASGPSFGNADINASFDSEDDENAEDQEDLMNNANDIYYADFFAPPSQAPSKKRKKRRALPKTQPSDQLGAIPNEEDMQRAINSARRDIFEEEEEDDVDLDNDSQDEEDPARALAGLSSHQRRQTALAAQIRSLEAAAIADKDWTLRGEARAVDRPENALLEVDLEFERTSKPLPPVTAEVTTSLEDMIKQRILARQFDDVPKRRPGVDVFGPNDARRGVLTGKRPVLDDRKDDRGLAAIYEDEHRRLNDPAYADAANAATKQAHEAIRQSWADIRATLDALCSWHYTPKPPELAVRVVSDAPAVAMEDARPGATGMGVGIGGDAGASGLAPQEVYTPADRKPSKSKTTPSGAGSATNGPSTTISTQAPNGTASDGDEDDVVVTKGGTVVARDEMTREEKRRRRRRAKERARKSSQPIAKSASMATGHANANAASTSAVSAASTAIGASGGVRGSAARREIVGTLKKGGVRVIGRSGMLEDVEGRKTRESESQGRTAAGLKL